MKISGYSAPDKFIITEDDRNWVVENFRWLIQVFGYPNSMEEQVLLTPKFFPATSVSQALTLDNLLRDLCKLFGIQREMVQYRLLTDMRDAGNIPYEVEGKVFECETELKKGEHTIYIASSLLRHPDRLIFSLIYEFIRIRLTESEIEYDVGGDDTGLFIYLAGIYYGFGVILAQNLVQSGRSTDGQSELKWNYTSEMPQQVMAFSLATYANLTGQDNPPWKHEFRSDFRKLFEGALAYVEANPNGLYDPKEVQANDLFNQANEYFDNNDLESAISTLQKILFLTSDDVMKADVYNNMGYYYMRKKEFTQGIRNFRKAVELGPAYGFALDNLGYGLILSGEIEEGFSFVMKAIDTGNNCDGYSFRNLALYYEKRKDFAKAGDYYHKALAEKTPVDLLEYHYGEFLLALGETEKAKVFFRKSAEKNEGEGAAKLRELERSVD